MKGKLNMRINVDFASHIDEIEFEPFLGKSAEEYQKAFEAWYYEETVVYVDGEKCIVEQQRKNLPYTCFDVNVFLDWMKEVAPSSNPRLIKETVGRKGYNKNLPSIHF